MDLLTIATDIEHPFLRRLLVPSLAAVGLELTILRPRTPIISCRDKRLVLMEYLSRWTRPDDLIMFTDAYDALFIRGEQHIAQAYARLPERVVFSAELNSWPLGVVGLALHKGPPRGRFPYLNSGGFIAPAGDLLDLGRRYPKPPRGRFDILERLRAHGYNTDHRFRFSDQYYWTLVAHLEPGWIGLDHDASIFEGYGRPLPDVVVSEVIREDQEFHEHGRTAAIYPREYDRLVGRLRSPSGAAHLHFAGGVAKAVVLDLLDERRLPDWMGVAHHPRQAFERFARVRDV
jgi:hypothetical protein